MDDVLTQIVESCECGPCQQAKRDSRQANAWARFMRTGQYAYSRMAIKEYKDEREWWPFREHEQLQAKLKDREAHIKILHERIVALSAEAKWLRDRNDRRIEPLCNSCWINFTDVD